MEYIDVRRASALWSLSERRITALCRAGRIAGAKKAGKQWLVPDTAPKPLDARTREFEATKVASPAFHTRKDSTMTTVQAFEKTYRREPLYTAFTPYRICPLGAHSDHQLGKITGFAIDRGIHMAYGKKENGVIEIASLQFPKRAQWHVASTPEQKQNDWADHLRGATVALHKRYPLRTGLCAVIDGELPIGGLSSSAAVILTFLSALCELNHISLSPTELITIAQEAENCYVGVACGKLDQSCEVYCKKDHLLFMDMKDASFELIPAAPTCAPYRIGIFFSGLERSLAGSKFNMRVDECRSAAYALQAYAGMEYGKFEEANLRDVPREVFEQYRDRLPQNWAKRADHFYTEYERVHLGAQAWRAGDLHTFGSLITQSGHSSIYNYETGSPELKALYEILANTDGVYGTRFSGAGFKGCCMALIDPSMQERIEAQVRTQYLHAFPHLSDKYSAHFCKSANGVML